MNGAAARPGAAVRLSAAARGRAGDAGITVIELVVSMSIMSVFLAMFTGGVVAMFRVANRAEAVSTAQSQVNTAFLRLDKEIRYAAGISRPGLVGADPYVEYLTTTTGDPVCTELRLQVASRQLQRRGWTRGAPPAAPSRWVPVASGVSAAQPFTVSAADDTFAFQRLRLSLAAGSGSGGGAVSRPAEVTFTALNSSAGTASDTVCTEGRAIP
jgi:type II secretory pathway pseudopilin PulG